MYIIATALFLSAISSLAPTLLISSGKGINNYFLPYIDQISPPKIFLSTKEQVR
jgi:hypothetical protein